MLSDSSVNSSSPIFNTGVGILEEFKLKLFQLMKTGESKGKGLGLAVVKRSVEVLKGTISFDLAMQVKAQIEACLKLEKDGFAV